jgi:hypothetical protein
MPAAVRGMVSVSLTKTLLGWQATSLPRFADADHLSKLR